MDRYLVTRGWKFEHERSFSSKAAANRLATQIKTYGGRAHIHDMVTGLIIRDTGRPYGQVWALPSKKGQKSPVV